MVIPAALGEQHVLLGEEVLSCITLASHCAEQELGLSLKYPGRTSEVPAIQQHPKGLHRAAHCLLSEEANSHSIPHTHQSHVSPQSQGASPPLAWISGRANQSTAQSPLRRLLGGILPVVSQCLMKLAAMGAMTQSSLCIHLNY